MYFEVGDLRKLAEVIDANELISDPTRTCGKNYKTVDRLPYNWEDRKKMLEECHHNGFPIPYQTYPEQYVGWYLSKVFSDKVVEIDNGVKPFLQLGELFRQSSVIGDRVSIFGI